MRFSTALFLPERFMSFEITVVELPAKHLIGMSVRTDMRKAQTDCPAVWQTFGPRIAGIPGRDGAGQGAYGVSFMLNENDFDYRAAVEAAPGTTVPDGMAAFEIPSGRYARCGVASFEQLGEAYMYVYGQWAPGQSEYALNMQAPCFELYPPNWSPGDAFEVYVPVV